MISDRAAGTARALIEVGWRPPDEVSYVVGWSRTAVVLIDGPRRLAHDEGIIHHLRTVLTHNGLDARLLYLGLTSVATVDDDHRPLRRLNGLTDLGTRLVLTDYGTAGPLKTHG